MKSTIDAATTRCRSRESGAPSCSCSGSKTLDPELPLIATGDFNAPAGENRVYTMLVESGPLVDTWRALGKDEPPLGTYHAFEGLETSGERGRIDWVLTRGPVEPLQAEVIMHSRKGQYPSDHFPVITTLRVRGR